MLSRPAGVSQMRRQGLIVDIHNLSAKEDEE
jgi:hypothetical protein